MGKMAYYVKNFWPVFFVDFPTDFLDVSLLCLIYLDWWKMVK